MEKISAVVGGVKRIVHLGSKIDGSRRRAKIYVENPSLASGRTSVTGVLQVYRNGTKRFSSNSENRTLLGLK